MSFFDALRRYWKTPKGRHDIKDYGRALLLILVVSAAIVVLLHFLSI